MSSQNSFTAPKRYMRCALYLRYSSLMQRASSLEDQERQCRKRALDLSWEVLDSHIYSDAARSGSTRVGRDGLDALEAAAQSDLHPFDCVLIDDTSRLGRDLVDSLNFVNDMKANGVEVFFVSQGLYSADPGFAVGFPVLSMMDEQFLVSHKQKVQRGLEGRFLKGFATGSFPYGYKGTVEYSGINRAVGRAATNGTRLEVIEEEAVVVRRIFELFADGNSLMRIVRKLNIEGVPMPYSKHREWVVDVIKNMLHNTKFIGVMMRGTTKPVRNRKTGQVKKVKTPVDEHQRKEVPAMRIVSDELWDRVQARLAAFRDKQAARVAGGYNRAKDGIYPFSGLIYCGLCDRRMRIGGTQGLGRYECPNHRNRMGCPNAHRILESSLTEQLSVALSAQLLVPETMSYMATAVFKELKEAMDRQKLSMSSDGIQQLQNLHSACMAKIENIVAAIEMSGNTTLLARLPQLEIEKRHLESQIKMARAARDMKVDRSDVVALLQSNVENLEGVMKLDAALARQVLQQHVKKLSLFPGMVDGKPYFEVIGELNLFNPPTDPNKGVLVGLSGTLNSQQHTVDSSYRFIMEIYANLEYSPLIDQLSDLLKAKPEVSLKPHDASTWALLLRDFIPEGRTKAKKLGYGAIGRFFRVARERLATRFDVVTTVKPKSIAKLYQVSFRATSPSLSEIPELSLAT